MIDLGLGLGGLDFIVCIDTPTFWAAAERAEVGGLHRALLAKYLRVPKPRSQARPFASQLGCYTCTWPKQFQRK